MALVSFPVPSRLNTNAITHSTTRQISHITHTNTIHINLKITTADNAFGNFHPPISGQPAVIQTRQRELLILPIMCAKNSPEAEGGGEDEQDQRALETVLKLNEAIKNKDALGLSEIIGDECQFGSNLSPIIKPLKGKKQVLDFFLYLIRHLGSDIEFVVRPTLHDGMIVDVQWSLEWNKKHVPLGKGFSFHICQLYKGKVVIKNIEMLMEPLLHIPFRMKVTRLMSAAMEKMNSSAIFKGGASKVVLCILYVLVTAAFIISFILISH